MENLINIKILGVPYPMVYVPKGNFLIGAGTGNTAKVSFDKGFYIGQYLVTQKLWKVIMGKGNNPSYFKGDELPIENVSWDEINKPGGFLDLLNEQVDSIKRYKEDNLQFRLPSESMWEYAAKGGNKVNPQLFAGSNKLEEVGWFRKNAPNSTMPVGLKMPNHLHLYDMSGNVFEWCQDIWHYNYKGIPRDGNPWVSNGDYSLRVARGGSWYYLSSSCFVNFRDGVKSSDPVDVIGFRISLY